MTQVDQDAGNGKPKTPVPIAVAMAVLALALIVLFLVIAGGSAIVVLATSGFFTNIAGAPLKNAPTSHNTRSRDAERNVALNELRAELQAMKEQQATQALDIQAAADKGAAEARKMFPNPRDSYLSRNYLIAADEAIRRHAREWKAKRNDARNRFIDRWGAHPDVILE